MTTPTDGNLIDTSRISSRAGDRADPFVDQHHLGQLVDRLAREAGQGVDELGGVADRGGGFGVGQLG